MFTAVARHSHRLKAVRRARPAIEARLATVVHRELRWAWNRLYPRLRHLAQHRRRAIGKRRLLKDFEFASTSQLWAIFETRLEARVLAELLSGALTLAQIEQAFWSARGEDIEIVPAKIVDLYRAEIGRREGREIVGVSDTTRRQAGQAIADWYNTPGSTLGDLVVKLQPLFSEARSRNIATTEATWLNSAVTLNSMTTLGLDRWNWQTVLDEVVCTKPLTGPDGNEWAGCRALHGAEFDVSQDMPPEGSHIGCRCSPVPKARPSTSPLGLAVAVGALAKDWSTVQRDDHGRWVEGGGSSENEDAAKAPLTLDQRREIAARAAATRRANLAARAAGGGRPAGPEQHVDHAQHVMDETKRITRSYSAQRAINTRTLNLARAEQQDARVERYRVNDEVMALRAQGIPNDDPRYAEAETRRLAANNRVEAAQKSYMDADRDHEIKELKLQSAERDELHKLITVPEAERATFQTKPSGDPFKHLPAKMQAKVDEGMGWLRTVTNRNAMGGSPPLTNQYIQMGDGDGRSYHSDIGGGNHVITYTAYASTTTVVHEMGHHLETSNPDILFGARDMIQQRRSSDELVPLARLQPGRAFDKSEAAWRDKFIDPYVGKYYHGATEVMSMGVENMYRDPADFFRKDPQHYEWTVRALNSPGSLRSMIYHK